MTKYNKVLVNKPFTIDFFNYESYKYWTICTTKTHFNLNRYLTGRLL